MSRPDRIMQRIRKDVRFAPDVAFDPKCPPEKSGFFTQNEANTPYRFPGKKGAYRTYARFNSNIQKKFIPNIIKTQPIKRVAPTGISLRGNSPMLSLSKFIEI